MREPRDGRPRSRAWRTATALVAALALAATAAACGDDDDDAADPATTAAAADTTAAAAATTAGGASATTAAGGTSATTAAAAGDAAPGTPAPQPLPEKKKLTASLLAQGVEAYAALHLARHFGEFEKENLEVEVTNLPSSDTLVGMISGQISTTPSGYQANVFNAIQGGSDLKWVSPLHVPPDDSRLGMWVRTDLVGDDGKFECSEFKGKSVSFGGTAGLAATSSWWMSEHLAQCDLTVLDLTLSTLAGPEMLIALESGSLDAGFLFDPIWADAEREGYAKLIVSQPRVALGGYLFGTMRDEEPEVVEAFVRAIMRTTRTYLQGDYHQDPDVVAGLVETMGVPEETITGGLSLVFDADLTFDPSPIVPMQEVWIGVGDILTYDTPMPADDLFDLRFIDEVLTQP